MFHHYFKKKRRKKKIRDSAAHTLVRREKENVSPEREATHPINPPSSLCGHRGKKKERPLQSISHYLL